MLNKLDLAYLIMSVLIQTHPNVDKKMFLQKSVIGLKQAGKGFPINSDIGVLKWRLQTTDDGLMPLSSKCTSLTLPLCHVTRKFGNCIIHALVGCGFVFAGEGFERICAR